MQQSIPVSTRVKNCQSSSEASRSGRQCFFFIKGESPTQQEDSAGKGLINIWIVLPKG